MPRQEAGKEERADMREERGVPRRKLGRMLLWVALDDFVSSLGSALRQATHWSILWTLFAISAYFGISHFPKSLRINRLCILDINIINSYKTTS